MGYTELFGILRIKRDHLISDRRPVKEIVNKKKKTCRIADFAIPADHRVKLKEIKKRYKYLDLARDLKNQLSMKVAVIPILNGDISKSPKELVHGLEDLEIRGGVETIQTTAVLRSA